MGGKSISDCTKENKAALCAFLKDEPKNLEVNPLVASFGLSLVIFELEQQRAREKGCAN